MSVAFGTSGLRGLVSALTDKLIESHVQAFLAACPFGTGLYVGQDLRASSPRIAGAVATAALNCGIKVTDCGILPTPALALAAMNAGAAAIMVTGSHIPDDRNGLKFYTPFGEITKQDEAAILSALDSARLPVSQGNLTFCQKAGGQYVDRYLNAFGPNALSGLRLGVYEHSSTARDILVTLVTALGGQAVRLARADHFIPVDTEALDSGMRVTLAGWAADLGLDAILSSDGDGDRPMLADNKGCVIAGDVLGVLTARAIGAEIICTPVSSNSMIEGIDEFHDVIRCKIGSPYVIAAMKDALSDNPAARVVGFEANGGFLLGYAAGLPMGVLPPLMTRDAVLPLIAPLAHARAKGESLAETLTTLPARATASDRLANIPSQTSAAFLTLLQDAQKRARFLAPFGEEAAVSRIDGLRIHLTDGRVLHLRPSGNAPEFRVYIEATNNSQAQDMLREALQYCAHQLENMEILQ